jgi:hypothetical protein
MRITRDLIERGRGENGAWTRAQLHLLGIAWPPERGWIDRVIDREISEEAAQAFLQRDPR